MTRVAPESKRCPGLLHRDELHSRRVQPSVPLEDGCPQGCKCWGRELRVRHRALLGVVCSSAPRGECHCSGEEEAIMSPAPAEPGVQSRELSLCETRSARVGAAPSCSSPRAGAGCHLRARGGAENPKPSRGMNARALHPFLSMDNHVQAHIPVWQSSQL